MLISFDKYVIKSILANNQFGIKEVNDLESLGSGFFIHEKYAEIDKLIREGNIHAITQLFKNQVKSAEFLEIMNFKDQNYSTFIVTVYDSNELSQDPQVIEIYKIN
jgi:hypothetical protein